MPTPWNAAARLTPCILALALIGCGPPPGTSGGFVPPGATPMGMVSAGDPVGFLLQFRDTLGIPDSTALQLSRLNIRLFRRNNDLRLRMDSLLRGANVDRQAMMRDTMIVPDSVRQLLAPLRAQVRSQTTAARDTAWAMLTESQRAKADTLEGRMRDALRRGPSPTMGAPQGTVDRP